LKNREKGERTVPEWTLDKEVMSLRIRGGWNFAG
jgi:hypothetical protein